MNTAALAVNVRDTSDFDDRLPEVLKSVVVRLREQANEPGGEVARQAMVLLYKTLRSVDQTGGATSGRREGTEP